MEATLTILGMPLDEEAQLHPDVAEALQKASVVIGESRKVTLRYLKRAGAEAKKEVFFLDPFRKGEWALLKEALTQLKARRENAVLFSDVGLPILFDPGREVLELCRKMGIYVRSVPGPTSWGTACSLSGFLPPFHIVGFLPKERPLRTRCLNLLRPIKANLVLMDTPYRFLQLLTELRTCFGQHQGFLAWEISKKDEQFFWGTIDHIGKEVENRGLHKGEFVVVIKNEK